MRRHRIKQGIAGIVTVVALAVVYGWREQQPWGTTENELGQTIQVMQTSVPWWHQALLVIALAGVVYILYLDLSSKRAKEETDG